MNILVVGNIIRDVYLNLDSRKENFELDKNGTKWLNLEFNASEHFFFSRESSLGGAAVTFEVLSKLGLGASVTDSDLVANEEGLVPTDKTTNIYRYIFISDGQPAYFAPSTHKITPFVPSNVTYDYLYIDRSAHLNSAIVTEIINFLDKNSSTKLIVYLENFNNSHLNSLLSKASLIFYENNTLPDNQPELSNVDSSRIIFISEDTFSYQDIHERVSVSRVDILTHLSMYSIASATILGCFVLGRSVEESLKMARINVENSKLNSTLSLAELQEHADSIKNDDNLELIAANLVLKPKGILAADESGGSIKKKFDQLNIEDTYDNRRDYRNIFFTTDGLENYVNGVILFDETARQIADNGQTFVDYLIGKRIIPGIKVDKGLELFSNSEETYTKGLEDLPTRLTEYHNLGLRFAKWRAAFNVRTNDQGEITTPTDYAINENCRILAEYAKACQSAKIVPIVEPELVYDGNYTIEQSADITSKILETLFQKLAEENVNLRACILKCNMVLAGKQQEHQSTPEEIGAKTAEVLKNHVPDNLAGIVFLSGGQTPEQATDNLREIIKNGPFSWPVTFSFARALQDPALFAWQGDNSNADTAREAFKERLIANSEALKS